MASPESPRCRVIPLSPIVDDDATARKQAFVAAHFPVRERRGFETILVSLAEHGIPTTLSELFGGDTSGSPYRSCTEHRASRRAAVKTTARVDSDILAQRALISADAGIIDLVPAWCPGSRPVLVLKAGFMTAQGIAPVEATRTTRSADLPRLVQAHIHRLQQADHRVPHLTANPSSHVVNAMLLASLANSMEWTGRVSAHWVPPSAIQWIEPATADVLSVAEAVALDSRRQNDTAPGFAWMQTPRDKLLVAYGPSSQGRYYLHRSLVAPDRARQSVEVIERRVLPWVERLDDLTTPLAGFPIEGLRIYGANHDSYRYVSRRILLAWQFPRWQISEMQPLTSANDEHKHPGRRSDEAS